MPAAIRSDTRQLRASPTLAAANGSSRTLDSVTSITSALAGCQAERTRYVRKCPVRTPGKHAGTPDIAVVTTSQQNPAVAPAPAAGTVTSVRGGCQFVPECAGGPARHRLARMRERAGDQQGGPGTLTDDLLPPEDGRGDLPDEPLAELAARYRLRPSAARPGVHAYAGQLWARRHFIIGFATASRVIPNTTQLIRPLPFPRACLPIGYVLIDLEQLVMSMVVLTVIVLSTGEPLTWYWLLAIPALLLQAVFNIGMGLFLARLGSGADDFSQLMPFLVRAWMYTSGVMYSISTISTLRNHPTVSYLLQINPAAVFISLVRNAILSTQRLAAPGSKPYNAALCSLYDHSSNPSVVYDSAYCHATVTSTQLWLYGAGWGVVAIVVGFVFFWQGEAKDGRG